MDKVISYYWDNIITPSTVKVVPIDDEKNKARVIVEPLQSGFGLTLGNAMRRVLLSSLCGAAVESVEIDGALSEYSVLQGVKEDINDIILNIKQLVLKVGDVQDHVIYLRVEDPGPVTAAMIVCEDGVEIVNPDLFICTLEKGCTLNMKIYVKFGMGYSQAKKSRKSGVMSMGRVAIDSLYSPVKMVNLVVESIRVGDITNYDKLVLEIETNGSISVGSAVELAAKILQNQFSSFINVNNIDVVDVNVESKLEPDKEKFDAGLLRKVDELDLSVRSHNCLKNANIIRIGDLVQKTEREMLRTPNFGKKSLDEINKIVVSLGYTFGMVISNWSAIVALDSDESEDN